MKVTPCALQEGFYIITAHLILIWRRVIMIRKLSLLVSFLTSWSRLVSEIKFHACYEAIKKRGWVYYFSNILQNSCMQSAQLFKHVAESNKI